MRPSDPIGIDEVVVGRLETGKGGTISETFPIPIELVGYQQLTLQMESEIFGPLTPLPFYNPSTVSASFTSPINGEDISPVTLFYGPYTSLSAGWTVFLIFNPPAKTDLYFPWPEPYTVVEKELNGTWKLEVDLSAKFDLSTANEYQVDLAIAKTDQAREELLTNQKLHFLTPDVIVMGKPIVVRHPAYKVINEDRILFSAWLPDENTMELFCARLDGSDVYRITYTPYSNEDNPSLSADGKKIAFVDTNGHAIWVMDSNGENRVQIYSNPDRLLEGPVFSPDGHYLAFSASEPNYPSPNRTTWNIYAVDLTVTPSDKTEQFALTQTVTPSVTALGLAEPFALTKTSTVLATMSPTATFLAG
jgi:hypothetical protein